MFTISKIFTLNKTVAALQAEIENLETNYDLAEEERAELAGEVKILSSQVSSAESEVYMLVEDVESLTETNETQNNEIWSFLNSENAEEAVETPEETDVTKRDSLFEDDFSSTFSGWDQYDDADFSTDYEDDAYVISVKTEEFMGWANPGQNFTDSVTEVDATLTDGELDNHYGIICRYEDVDNFYVLMISSDGWYAIAKRVDGELIELIGNDSFEFSDEIEQGNQTNRIKAECIGDTMSLYVNNTLLLEATDTDLSSGDTGLLVGTLTASSTEITFDNFIVREP